MEANYLDKCIDARYYSRLGCHPGRPLDELSNPLTTNVMRALVVSGAPATAIAACATMFVAMKCEIPDTQRQVSSLDVRPPILSM